MKNYFVKILHRIGQDTETFGDSLNAQPVIIDYSTIDYYEQMQKISIPSFKKNLLGDWKLVYFSESFASLQDSFMFTFNETYRLWKTEPCNVLFADVDTVCFKPTEIFGKPWAPGSRSNCALRYFPHDMPQSAWDIALEYIENWDRDLYDYEQLMYNAMSVGSALPVVEDLVHQAPAVGLLDQDNSNVFTKDVFTKMDDAKSVIHLHSSRSPLNALMAMRRIGYGA